MLLTKSGNRKILEISHRIATGLSVWLKKEYPNRVFTADDFIGTELDTMINEHLEQAWNGKGDNKAPLAIRTVGQFRTTEQLRTSVVSSLMEILCHGHTNNAKAVLDFNDRLNGPINRVFVNSFRQEREKIPTHMGHDKVPMTDELLMLAIGVKMEQTKAMLTSINAEVVESKNTLQSLANEVSALADVIAPSLIKQIDEIRKSRMAMASEIRELISPMRDLRKFFLESDYEIEMQRMERFVKLCRDVQELKSSGVFDAVADTALRLSEVK